MQLTQIQIKFLNYLGRKQITVRDFLRPAMRKHGLDAEAVTEIYHELKALGLVSGDRVRNGFAKKPRHEVWLTDAGRVQYKMINGVEAK